MIQSPSQLLAFKMSLHIHPTENHNQHIYSWTNTVSPLCLVNVEQEAFKSDVESRAEVEATPAVESPGKESLPLRFCVFNAWYFGHYQSLQCCYCWYVCLLLLSFTQLHHLSHPYLPAVEMEKPLGCVDSFVTDSESAGRFAQTPDSCQETPEERQQQERRDPELQVTQKVLEDTQETSLNPAPLPSAASVNTEQQNQSKPSLKAEHVPKHPERSPGPQTLPRISVGRCLVWWESGQLLNWRVKKFQETWMSYSEVFINPWSRRTEISSTSIHSVVPLQFGRMLSSLGVFKRLLDICASLYGFSLPC